MTIGVLIEITRIENIAIAYVVAHDDLTKFTMKEFVDKVKAAGDEIAQTYKADAGSDDNTEVTDEFYKHYTVHRADSIIADYVHYHYDLKKLSIKEYLDVCEKEAKTLRGIYGL